MDVDKTYLSRLLESDPQDIDEGIVDKLLLYNQILEENDLEFYETAMENMHIEFLTISWNRPWYQQAKQCTLESIKRSDKPDDENETFIAQAYSSKEIEIIENNWKKLCKKYDLPDQPISIFRCLMKSKCRADENRIKTRFFLIAYLARGLKRTLFQVHRRCITQFLYFNKGKYSDTEKKIAVTFLSNCSSTNSAKVLARLLNRPIQQIYITLDDIRFGKKEPAVRKRWNLSRATKLLRYLMKYTKLPLEELKNRHIERRVWLHMEEKMDNKEWNLSRFWYANLHVQLFVQEDVKYRETLVRVFNILKTSPYQKWKDIEWKEIVKQFPDGFTWWFLYLNCFYRLRKTWAHKNMTVAEAAQYFLTEGIRKVKRRRLKRLKLNENRQLEYIRKK